ncbi:MAG TPA: ECF transporter S component [Anaerolineae bacterium]|nr:ECF transporter S component [Anaerolineae bacterium]
MKDRKSILLSSLIYLITNLVGLVGFFYPFFLPLLSADRAQAASPWLMTLLVGFCFVALLLEVQGDALNARFVALLGVLVALNAVLRFIETAIPGPGGFSPIFFLILTTGYVFGARFGFLMGALTLLVSALITGGVGPWLPYQMFTAGWVGATSAGLRVFRLEGRRGEVALLVALGAVWGLFYGMLMNLYFWPFAAGLGDQQWTAGLSWIAGFQRYAAFYVATSLAWDIVGALGNVLLLSFFAAPTLRALRRFRRRFTFIYQAEAL